METDFQTRSVQKDLWAWVTRADRLLSAAGIPNPRFDAESLLASVLGVERIGLFLHPERLKPAEQHLYLQHLRRRCRREPLQYILGEVFFLGRPFRVTPDVLIPRPETEWLVAECLERGPVQNILDVGTGSGCIAVSLACAWPNATVLAVDISERALRVAADNAARHQVGDRVRLLCGDLDWAIRSDYRADLVVANLPYVARSETSGLQAEVRDYEPPKALHGGADGLDLIRRLIATVPPILPPEGLLALEIGADQGDRVRALLAQSADLDKPRIERDLTGRERMVFVRKAPTNS